MVQAIEQHISAGNLRVKPLSHGALISRGAARQFIRMDGAALGHGPVEAKFVPQVGHDTAMAAARSVTT
jgi:hypothetical protein